MPAIAEPKGIPTNVKIQPIFSSRAAMGLFLNSSPFNKEIDLPFFILDSLFEWNFNPLPLLTEEQPLLPYPLHPYSRLFW